MYHKHFKLPPQVDCYVNESVYAFLPHIQVVDVDPIVYSLTHTDHNRQRDTPLFMLKGLSRNIWTPLEMDPPRTPWMLQEPYLNQI